MSSVNRFELDPLLRGTFTTLENAGEVLKQRAATELLERVVRRYRLRAGGLGLDTSDFSADIVFGVLERASNGGGLTPPSGERSPESDRAWLFRVFDNMAKDVLRKASRRRRGELRPDTGGEGDESADIYANVSGPDSAVPSVERLEVKRKLGSILRALTDGSVPPHHALVLVVEKCPEWLSRALIERAVEWSGRGIDADAGLARNTDETWELLNAHFLAELPLLVDNRLALAWVLRSNAPRHEGPDVWAQRDRAAARKALETVRKWGERALLALQRQLGGPA